METRGALPWHGNKASSLQSVFYRALHDQSCSFILSLNNQHTRDKQLVLNIPTWQGVLCVPDPRPDLTTSRVDGKTISICVCRPLIPRHGPSCLSGSNLSRCHCHILVPPPLAGGKAMTFVDV